MKAEKKSSGQSSHEEKMTQQGWEMGQLCCSINMAMTHKECYTK